jgi:hypothetical protein
VTQDPVVTQRENVVAVTEDDSAGPPPAADRASTDEAVAPAGEPVGEAPDVGAAAQADAHDGPSGQDGQDEPGGRDEPASRTGRARPSPGGTVAVDAGAVAADADDEADEDDERTKTTRSRASPGAKSRTWSKSRRSRPTTWKGFSTSSATPTANSTWASKATAHWCPWWAAPSGELVGPRGEVLEALQELTRLAVHRQTGERTRLMLDVGGYRARRRMELTALGRDAAEDVSRTGVARRLEPMTPFERKIVHDAVAAAGLRSESEGEEPNRRVVVLPAG